MAGARKLQAEVDRTLKAITEHIIEFESIWDKVINAATLSLKEKYEGDLKKEIKKLQRMRDQLKGFIQSNEIKMKKPLLDARKQIEIKMEQFKILERETKTKAYSREGLNQASRRPSSGDAEDERRDEMLEWIDQYIDQLQSQIDEAESKLESQTQQAPVKGKKSKRTVDTNAINDEAQHTIERHAFHISRLNQIKDGIDSDLINLDDVEDIKDDIDYYVNNNDQPDFDEDETIYDSLQLDDVVAPGSDEEVESANESFVDLTEDLGESRSPENEEKAPQSPTKGGVKTAPTKPAVTVVQPKPAISIAAPLSAKQAASSPTAISKPISSPPTAAPRPNQSINPVAAATAAIVQKKPATAPTPVTPAPLPIKPMESLASIVMKSKAAQAHAPSAVAASPSPPKPAAAAPLPTIKPVVSTAVVSAPAAAPTSAAVVQSAVSQLPSRPTPSPTPSIKSVSPDHAQTPPVSSSVASVSPSTSSSMSPQRPASSLSHHNADEPSPVALASTETTSHTVAPVAFEAAPLKDRGDRSTLGEDYFYTLSQIDVSMKSFPQHEDTERIKTYIPRNPYRTPPYFPSQPAPIFDDPALFEKLGIDTLLFIFYFQQGTPHQYLAARELKKQSWRYHKNFLTWFQRHEDPKLTTEEYEQGTYVYFDYESGWCQRIKQDFTFEYRHLEDELSVPQHHHSI